MFENPLAIELAYIAVEEAVRLGASYADARFELHEREDINSENGALSEVSLRQQTGLGIRVLVSGAWGFSAVSTPNRHDAAAAARRAVAEGRAHAVLRSRPVEMAEHKPQRALYRTPIKRDPLAVPIEEKVALLLKIDEQLRGVDLIVRALVGFHARRVRKIYVNSEGSEIDQELVYTGLGFQAGASDGHDYQTRSFPAGNGGLFMGKGWELIRELPLVESARPVAEEAVAQLKAAPCPSRETTLVLGSLALAHPIQGVCERAMRLDAALGGGESALLTTSTLGQFEFGSPLVNLYADAREVGAAGTFGFDDEGVAAQRIDLVTEGRFTGYLCGRETAHQVGLKRSSGTMRAPDWRSCPAESNTNIFLAPGKKGTLEELLADTASGVFVDVGHQISLEDNGRSFLSSCEVAFEIKDGRFTRRLRNPSYRGQLPRFWKSCDGICGPSEWKMFGIGRCEDGVSGRYVPVGCGASPSRFRDVEIGFDEKNLPRHQEGEAIALVNHPEASVVSDLVQKPGHEGARRRRAWRFKRRRIRRKDGR